MKISFLIFLTVLLSNITVIKASNVANWLSSPNKNNMIKNSTAHKGAAGISVRACENITNAKPGPMIASIHRVT